MQQTWFVNFYTFKRSNWCVTTIIKSDQQLNFFTFAALAVLEGKLRIFVLSFFLSWTNEVDLAPWNSLHVDFAVEIYVFAASRDGLAPFYLGFIFFKLCEESFDLRVVEGGKLSLLADQGPSNGLKPVLMPIESE